MMLNSAARIDSAEGLALLYLHSNWTPISLLIHEKSPPLLIWQETGEKIINTPSFHGMSDAESESAKWFTTPLETLHQLIGNSAGIPIQGIAWHMSRCGSTLARNLLGAVKGKEALGEPPLFNGLADLLNSSRSNPRAGQHLNAALRYMMRPRQGLSGGYIKASSYTVLNAEEIHKASPNIPKIFIHRNPIEVMVSLLNQPPSWARTENPIPPLKDRGITPSKDRVEHVANILAAYLRAALQAARDGYCRLVAYPDIIDRFIDGDIPEYFGYVVDEENRQRMLAASSRNAKAPGSTFQNDVLVKSELAKQVPDLAEYVKAFVDPIYNEVLSQSQWPK